jgi:hypothetical protein
MRVSVVGQGRELSSIWYPGNEGVRESLGTLTDQRCITDEPSWLVMEMTEVFAHGSAPPSLMPFSGRCCHVPSQVIYETYLAIAGADTCLKDSIKADVRHMNHPPPALLRSYQSKLIPIVRGHSTPAAFAPTQSKYSRMNALPTVLIGAFHHLRRRWRQSS